MFSKWFLKNAIYALLTYFWFSKVKTSYLQYIYIFKGIAKKHITPSDIINHSKFVLDNPKLLDDGGDIPKSQGRGWRFDSRL